MHASVKIKRGDIKKSKDERWQRRREKEVLSKRKKKESK